MADIIVSLGIDASLTHTGVVVLKDQSMVHSNTLVFKTRGPERLIQLRDAVDSVLKEHQPNLAMIEGYAYMSKSAHSAGLYELGGVLRVLLYERKIPYFVIAPPSLKKFATSSGRADKNIVLKAVYKEWGVDFDDDNRADAFVLAKVGYYFHPYLKEGKTYSFPSELNKSQIEVLKLLYVRNNGEE